MNLHTVLTAVDNCPLYLDFVPFFYKTWKKLFPETDIKIIYINDKDDTSLPPYVTHFQAIPGVHSAFQSQCIRLLWPSLIGQDKNITGDDGVLITDIDMIPLNTRYYTETLKNIRSEQFVCFRNVISHIQQYPICYNAATPRTWNDLFKINSIEDINDTLMFWYEQTSYDGKHGGQGWSFDQAILFKTANSWEQLQKATNHSRLVLLNDKTTGFKRLDRSQYEAILKHLPSVIKLTSQGEFSDFHLPRPYHQHEAVIDKIVSAL